jgi:hypothetical protein
MGNHSISLHRRYWLKVFGRFISRKPYGSFFLEGYLPTRRLRPDMPSKYMVSVSLDLETITAWEALPMGEKSKRIREALRTASIVSERDLLIKCLDKQIKRLKDEVYFLRHGGE